MSVEKHKKFGIAFSGGGYRATTYHIGTLRALHDSGVINKVDVIAANSGGSITGAYYALHSDSKSYPVIEQDLLTGLKSNVIMQAVLHPRCIIGLIYLVGLLFGSICLMVKNKPIEALACLTLFVLSVLKFQYLVFPISLGIRSAYNRIFFNGKTLTDLVESPKLVMNASNVETGKLWSFSRNKMDDSSYRFEINPPVLFKTDGFPIARAVNASSCVPFAFSPVSIPKKYFFEESFAKRVRPLLVDGGVYDNQGIHKLIQDGSSFECDVVLVSDAGAGMKWVSNQKNVLSLLIRMTNIFMLRIKNLQMISGVFENSSFISKQRQIGYFSLSMNPVNAIPFFVEMFKKKQLTQEVINAHQLSGRENDSIEVLVKDMENNIHWNDLVPMLPSAEEMEVARKVSTNLVPLKCTQTKSLIKHAYVMSLIFLRLYCPAVLNTQPLTSQSNGSENR